MTVLLTLLFPILLMAFTLLMAIVESWFTPSLATEAAAPLDQRQIDVPANSSGIE